MSCAGQFERGVDPLGHACIPLQPNFKEGGIIHQTVLFTGQISPESGKEPTPVASAEWDINNTGLGTSWKLGRVRGDLKSTSRHKQLAEN